MNSLVKTLVDHWWVFFLFGGSILGAIGACFEGFRDFIFGVLDRRRQHQVEIEQIRSGRALPEGSPRHAAGPCPHRPKNVKPVIGTDEELKAWLCTACDTRLPATWAVLEEDL